MPAPASPLRLVAYIRVSTDAQVEHGHGLDVQRTEILRWAERHGHEVVAWAADEGVSGSNGIESREGLPEALDVIERGDAEGLVVWKLDRLARSLTHQEAILGKLWSLGGHVLACDLGEVPQDDPDDPMRTAMRQMVGVFAQLERSMIALRMRKGRAHVRAQGGYLGGHVPLGYQLGEPDPATTKRKLVTDDDESATVRRILELHAEGHSLRSICRTIEAEGYRTKRGGRWAAETVRLVVRRNAATDS